MQDEELELGAIVPGGQGKQNSAEDDEKCPERQPMHDIAGDDANDPGEKIKFCKSVMK